MQCGVRSAGLILALLLTAVQARPAEDDGLPPPPPASVSLLGAAQQVGDDELQVFEPARPRTEADKRRSEARAWYMAGKIHEARGEVDEQQFEMALKAFRRAVELDPGAIDAYQALIPILYTRNARDEARQYALQAVGAGPRGYQIARGLAAIMARGETVAAAADLLREAIALDVLDPMGIEYLVVQRDLGLYLHMSEQPVEAAAAFRLVMEALLDTERTPPLTDEQRDELLGDAGTTYDEFGKAFLEAKLPDLAVRAFDEAAKHREGRPGIHSYNLAMVFRETGKPESGLEELRKYFDAQLQSKGRGAYELLKSLLTDLNRSEEVIPELERLFNDDPRNSFLAYFLADEYVLNDQLDKAAELYQKTLGSSTDPRGLIGLLEVYRRQHNGAELVTVLGKLYPQMPQAESDDDLQKLPTDVRNLVARYQSILEELAGDDDAMDSLLAAGRDRQQDGKIEIAESYMLGKMAIDADRRDDAVNFYELTISMLNRPTLDLYRELGGYLVDKKEFDKAVEVYRSGADHPAMQQSRFIFLYYLSYPLEYGGKTDEALQAIAEARGLQAENPLLQFQEAWIHYHAHHWETATEQFRTFIADHPDQLDMVRICQFSLSNIFVQQGDKEQGEQILEDVLKDDPENSQANNDLGYLWADQGKNLERARTMIEKALKAEPENPAYLDSMGWVLYRLDQFDDARRYLEQAIAIPDGEDSTILDHLGDCLDKLGDSDGAQTRWRRALEIEQEKSSPDEKLIKTIQEKLPKSDAAANSGS